MSATENSPYGLYRPGFEKDNCGFGLIAQMQGQASHRLVQAAKGALTRLTHRGAIAADGKSGDGCGLLLQKPDKFLRTVAAAQEINLAFSYAVGTVFLSRHKALAEGARRRLEEEIVAQDLVVAGWRRVPINATVLGEEALQTLPIIEQVFINAPDGLEEGDLERRLFLARRRTEKALAGDPCFYVPSLSSRVLSYKALVLPFHLSAFYPDLQDERLEAAICVFHQRFSTNTLPQWRLAQPFRYLAHNGEINTIRGNRNWALARGAIFKTPLLPRLQSLQPWVDMEGSDSCSLDNMLEVLLAGGMDLFRALRLLVPSAWQKMETIDPDLRAFYEYHSMHMEPWDGPAGVVLTDGTYAACILDRNGLRPARYVLTRDHHLLLASEVGVCDYAPEEVITKGRLKPGEMVAVNTKNGGFLQSRDIDKELKNRHPYRQWLEQHRQSLATTSKEWVLHPGPLEKATLTVYQKLFQVSFEEREQVLRVLAEAGQEAVGSMGDDTPMPVLSRQVRPLYDSFRQQFAQVTNPPIDSLREQIVMSLETCFGPERNLFEESEAHAARVVVDTPLLSPGKYRQLLSLPESRYAHEEIDLNYEPGLGLAAAIGYVCERASRAVRAGKTILVLSDWAICPETLPLHALLATGAVHHHLIQEGLRCRANIVVATATARDPHHVAVLLGYGATAVYPYLAYECLHGMVRYGEISGNPRATVLAENYAKGVCKGLLKILSKMGISTIASYRGAQLFEIVGLADEVVDTCFKGTISRIQGSHFSDLEKDQKYLARLAWNPRKSIAQGGMLKFVHGGEYHAYNPDVVQALHQAVQSGDYGKYRAFAELVNERPVAVLRDLLGLSDKGTPIPLEEVEPIEALLPRFDSAGMSLGALSPEAHEALAVAMNRLGGRSNSGEGGEDSTRYGTEKVSKIKQIASGRFGVTPHYLINVEVIQIKIAQGAKPGEGGQLPGHKVNELIATLRYCKPGVALISPPPHHDIYSIEDLAQLIFDLKQVNPAALVSVKLVSEAGVGTIAAGVAKAYADLITISGYDGGTGASPLTSVKYAGTPWELGLSEAHQTLRANSLRDKVRLQTDGGLKTGLDVVKAAILGAESFGFGTGPMVALGCKYLRICHLNNCATGVATQNNILRLKHFIGLPEMVMNYFRFVAQETREWMSKLGVRRLEELIGRTELLEIFPGITEKQQRLDLSSLLATGGASASRPQFCREPHNVPFDKGLLAERMVADTQEAIARRQGGDFAYTLQNVNRSIGARLSGEIAKRYGNQGMVEAPITVRCTGTAGQSFGAWNAGGLNLILEGEANDYVGKGMAGGKVIIYPPRESFFESQKMTIMGNTCLYGATGGTLFASGCAGERFAVRNSGAVAIVEGVGDHGCEYMTGGVVTVLGQTGINFGAGMTGGVAFVLDLEEEFRNCYNHELIEIHRVHTENMSFPRGYLYESLQAFVEETESRWGRSILERFSELVPQFWLVKPKAAAIEGLRDTLRKAA